MIAINRDTTARRIYEDTIVAQFAARGIKARASYKLLRDLGAAPPPDIEMTMRKTGVDAVLISRTLRASTGIRATPGYSYVPIGPVGFHGMWGTFSTAPNVYAVQSMEIETRLFDVKHLALLWSGSSTTTSDLVDATNHHRVRNGTYQGARGRQTDLPAARATRFTP